jgi:putative endonuclease
MPKKNNTGKQGGWVVYMLACRDGSLYTGITNNLSRRMAAHQAGKGSRFVRSRLPFRLARVEEVGSKSAALKREAAIKGLDRRGKVALVRGKL